MHIPDAHSSCIDYLPPILIKDLQKPKGIAPDTFVLIHNSIPINYKWFNKMFKAAAAKAKLPPVTPKILRYASAMIDIGANPNTSKRKWATAASASRSTSTGTYSKMNAQSINSSDLETSFVNYWVESWAESFQPQK